MGNSAVRPGLLLLPAAILIALVSLAAALAIVHGPITSGTFPVLILLWLAAACLLPLPAANIWLSGRLGTWDIEQQDRQRLDALWARVCQRAGVAPGRYALRVTTDEARFHRDLGWHVVTVGRSNLWGDDQELSAALAQGLARQTSLTAPVLGVCAWAALPLLSVLCVAWVLLVVARGVSRGAGAFVDEFKPRGEAQAAVGLVVMAVGIGAFLVVLVVATFIALAAIVGFVLMLLAACLARHADRATDDVAIEQGHGSGLLAAASRALARGDLPAAGWRRALCTYAPATARLKVLRRASHAASGFPLAQP